MRETKLATATSALRGPGLGARDPPGARFPFFLGVWGQTESSKPIRALSNCDFIDWPTDTQATRACARACE